MRNKSLLLREALSVRRKSGKTITDKEHGSTLLKHIIALGSMVLLVGCQSLPNIAWDGYRKAEAVILLDSQLSQIDHKLSRIKPEHRESAMAIIRTLKVLGQYQH